LENLPRQEETKLTRGVTTVVGSEQRKRSGPLKFHVQVVQERAYRRRRSGPSDLAWIADSHQIQEELHEV
jgi:hypothetical protein